ncbi:hypothetical protein M0802_016988 [Mischocyttarus mexicanus]|nr:hypothetical protein M0802_016988 [Mischocyttarus mexicanus]
MLFKYWFDKQQEATLRDITIFRCRVRVGCPGIKDPNSLHSDSIETYVGVPTTPILGTILNTTVHVPKDETRCRVGIIK